MPVDQQDRDPRDALKQVVRARHPVEAQAARDAALRAARRAKVAENQVRIEVAELAHEVERDGGVGEEGRGIGRGGR